MSARAWAEGRLNLPPLEPNAFGSTFKGAVLSEDRHYRYSLTRTMGKGPVCLFVMLNPSTADENADDPTIKRCMMFATREGCAVLHVVNVFAIRTSKPSALAGIDDPMGPENYMHIRRGAGLADLIIAGWGEAKEAEPHQLRTVRTLLTAYRPVYCLGTTKAGAPKHPLARGVHRVPDDQPLSLLWEMAQ